MMLSSKELLNEIFGGDVTLVYPILNETNKLWQPQVGEWCWLYGKLIKLTDISSIEYCQYITSVGDNDEASYEYLQSNCEPFIGTLPTFLKDK